MVAVCHAVTRKCISTVEARAPQVGHALRLFTVCVRFGKPNHRPLDFRGVSCHTISIPNKENHMATFAINDKLAWTVSKRTLCYMTADGLQPWNEKQAVVRDDNDVALGVVSPEYELVQNEDLKSLINPMVSEGVLTIVKQGYLNKGARVFIQAEVNQEFQVVGENYKGLITLLNGHTGNASVAIGTTATRVICGNTFSMAYKDIGEKFRHSAGVT